MAKTSAILLMRTLPTADRAVAAIGVGLTAVPLMAADGIQPGRPLR